MQSKRRREEGSKSIVKCYVIAGPMKSEPSCFFAADWTRLGLTN
jgi:hypothetical protein